VIRLLRANADLRWLFIAQVVSFMGDWFSFVAVTGIVKEATGSEFLVSLAYVSFSLPSFLVSPIAGSPSTGSTAGGCWSSCPCCRPSLRSGC